jgi:hypothetical protein
MTAKQYEAFNITIDFMFARSLDVYPYPIPISSSAAMYVISTPGSTNTDTNLFIRLTNNVELQIGYKLPAFNLESLTPGQISSS